MSKNKQDTSTDSKQNGIFENFWREYGGCVAKLFES